MNKAITVTASEVAFHRNGIAGESFHVVLFTKGCDGALDPDRFIAVVFEGKGQCAVFNLENLNEGEIRFGSNSWRGDQFEPGLREVINEEVSNEE